MIAALLLAGVTSMTAVDAERAFAADAQELGQWTAFRKWAAPEAIMFDPQPVKVSEVLKNAKDPPRAVEWWPTASYVSCDGTMAVNTGGWERPNGSVGYFTTVWRRQRNGGWKWVLDHGDNLTVARERLPSVRAVRATCRKPLTRLSNLEILEDGEPQLKTGDFASTDGTLKINWSVGVAGWRNVMALVAQRRRTGDGPLRNYLFQVVRDVVAAPLPKPQ